MTGSFGEMGNLLKQAQEMQREINRVREELRETVVEGTAGGGAVRVEVTGDRKVQKVELSDEVASSGDRGMIEDLVLAALRDGLGKAEKLAEESLGKVTGGVNLPGLF
jgi:DNA-binding YbaB/EbfC family protein